MKNFSVSKLSKISGVSPRTLHYYDQIGLLKPADRTEAGYRFYGEKEMLRLQQILFYRELDIPLKMIADILDDPDYSLLGALESHKKALINRRKRIKTLLSTIDNTITQIKTGREMTKPEELYEGLPKEIGSIYRKEAIDKYGQEKVEHSERELMKLGKEGFKFLQKEFDELNSRLFTLCSKDPGSIEVQKAMQLHYNIIRKFWGTHGSADKQAEAYAGLGQLYMHDERYTMIDGKPQPEFAKFLQKAMKQFAKTLK